MQRSTMQPSCGDVLPLSRGGLKKMNSNLSIALITSWKVQSVVQEIGSMQVELTR
jgi:hypothetical protein